MTWLDDEANNSGRNEKSDLHEQELIRRSNYWALIIEALHAEIEAINSHHYWKSKVGAFPVKLVKPFGFEGWQVNRSGTMFVAIEIQNRANHVLIGRQFSDPTLYSDFKKREKLRVDTRDNRVILITEDGEFLMVPDAVVQYLLKAVIQSLKRPTGN